MVSTTELPSCAGTYCSASTGRLPPAESAARTSRPAEPANSDSYSSSIPDWPMGVSLWLIHPITWDANEPMG